MEDRPSKTDKPVTKAEEITKIYEDGALPDEALKDVTGGDMSMQQRGSNG